MHCEHEVFGKQTRTFVVCTIKILFRKIHRFRFAKRRMKLYKHELLARIRAIEYIPAARRYLCSRSHRCQQRHRSIEVVKSDRDIAADQNRNCRLDGPHSSFAIWRLQNSDKLAINTLIKTNTSERKRVSSVICAATLLDRKIPQTKACYHAANETLCFAVIVFHRGAVFDDKREITTIFVSMRLTSNREFLQNHATRRYVVSAQLDYILKIVDIAPLRRWCNGYRTMISSPRVISTAPTEISQRFTCIGKKTWPQHERGAKGSCNSLRCKLSSKVGVNEMADYWRTFQEVWLPVRPLPPWQCTAITLSGHLLRNMTANSQ